MTDTTLAFAVSSSRRGSKDKTNKKQSNEDDEDDDEQPYGEPPFTLIPSSSVEVHRKMVAALETLAAQQHDNVAGQVVQALFDAQKQQSTAACNNNKQALTDFRQRLSNPNLDDSQVEAIQFAL